MSAITKVSTLAKIIAEATQMAEVRARLEISDWNSEHFFDRLRDEFKAMKKKSDRRSAQPYGFGPRIARADLIRLACLCTVGAWILDLEGP